MPCSLWLHTLPTVMAPTVTSRTSGPLPKLPNCTFNGPLDNSAWVCDGHLKLNMPEIKLLATLSSSALAHTGTAFTGNEPFTRTFLTSRSYRMAL